LTALLPQQFVPTGFLLWNSCAKIALQPIGVAELGYYKFIVRSPKNNTSKNADLMHCPESQSTHVNKNGQKKGKHNYIFFGCGKQFIDCSQPHKAYSENVKSEAIKMYVSMGF
jgi:hypothetical protein